MPLPRYGFDPTETAIPWKILSRSGVEVVFATPNGEPAEGDSIMVTGEKLGVWKRVLQARYDAVEAYHKMKASTAFQKPLRYSDIHDSSFDGLLLPGGHDKGVKEYLESADVQRSAVHFFASKKPVAAICHGVVVLARSINPATGQSVLHSYKTTALLKSQELTAYNMTRLWLEDYYLTYPAVTVEEEVRAALAEQSHFLTGKQPLFRDDEEHTGRGFTVRDRNYLSARWPGDAYSFSLAFVRMLQELAD